MLEKLFNLVFYLFFCVTCAFFFVIALGIRILTGWFDKRLVLLHLFSSFWGYMYLWCVPSWSVIIDGREKLDFKKQYILVSNHQSQLDILLAFGLFFPFKWISKAEVFNLPFIGWNMRLNRYIRLKRGDKTSIQKMMAECEHALNQGCSLYFFPEGTRSVTGVLKPFRTGAFVLAQKMKVPIMAIAINGTLEALPKQSLLLTSNQRLELCVLQEIPYEMFADLPAEVIADKVRHLIAENVKAHKKSESYASSAGMLSGVS